MTDLERRVLDCFANVFPGKERAELSQLSPETHAEWDSVAHVTLMAALGEEFDFEVDFEAAQDVRSYASVVAWVRNTVSDR